MPILYSRPSCGPCQTLKYFLNKKGIIFKELPAPDNMMVPTLKYKDQVIVGLNLPRISELLSL